MPIIEWGLPILKLIAGCLVMFVTLYAIAHGHAVFGFAFLIAVGAVTLGWVIIRERAT